MTLLIGWRVGKGGEWVKAKRAIWKVTYCSRLSWAPQKKHTVVKKRAVTCVKQREDGFEGKQYSGKEKKNPNN